MYLILISSASVSFQRQCILQLRVIIFMYKLYVGLVIYFLLIMWIFFMPHCVFIFASYWYMFLYYFRQCLWFQCITRLKMCVLVQQGYFCLNFYHLVSSLPSGTILFVIQWSKRRFGGRLMAAGWARSIYRTAILFWLSLLLRAILTVRVCFWMLEPKKTQLCVTYASFNCICLCAFVYLYLCLHVSTCMFVMRMCLDLWIWFLSRPNFNFNRDRLVVDAFFN